MSKEEAPLVSIVCTAYNHEDYIKDALEGFVSQKTTFPFEIIVHDDASTDSTAEIIKEYEQKYPYLFFNIYQKENQYSKGVDIWGNLFQNHCRGKYIAICEGDDYWIDPLKLQKQVDFLEKNQEYGMIYGRVKYYENETGKYLTEFGSGIHNIQELLIGNVIPTLTVCLRKDLYVEYYNEIQPFHQNWKMGDYPMWLWFSYRSLIKFMENIIGIYRILPESVSHSKDYRKELNFVKDYNNIKIYFADKFNITDECIHTHIKEQYIIGIFRIFLKHPDSLGIIKSEVDKFGVWTLKIYIIRLAIRFRLIRLFLRLYWNIH